MTTQKTESGVGHSRSKMEEHSPLVADSGYDPKGETSSRLG